MVKLSSKWGKKLREQISNVIREHGEPLFITSDGVCQYETFVCIPDVQLLKAIRGKINARAFMQRTVSEFEKWKKKQQD